MQSTLISIRSHLRSRMLSNTGEQNPDERSKCVPRNQILDGVRQAAHNTASTWTIAVIQHANADQRRERMNTIARTRHHTAGFSNTSATGLLESAADEPHVLGSCWVFDISRTCCAHFSFSAVFFICERARGHQHTAGTRDIRGQTRVRNGIKR